MGIDIRWEDESGKQLEEITDPEDCLGIALSLSDLKETACLRFIDPYGDTVFNQLQIPIFIDELQVLRNLVTEERLSDFYQQRNTVYQTTQLTSDVFEKIKRRQQATSAIHIVRHIDKVLALARRSNGDAHTHLKCYGD